MLLVVLVGPVPDLYRIKDWSSRYETNETRKLKSLSWVKLNNKMDGLSFRLLAKHKDAPSIFAAWVLMLELASKSTPRGDLSHNNLPLSPGEMGEITGFPGEIFEQALLFLSDPKIGWIERISPSPGASGENPGTSGKSPGTPPVDEIRGEEREWKGREEIEREDFPALALEVVKAYPDQAKKDGRPIQKGIHAQSLALAAIKKRPDHPWVEHATLVRELVDMPYNLDKWLREFSDEASLESLRKSKNKSRGPRSSQREREFDEHLEL